MKICRKIIKWEEIYMFILVECCDRNMELLGVHDKKTEAFENLESHLVSAMDLKEIPANWDQTPFKRDTDFEIDEDSAWLNRSSCEYDWKIWEIPQKVSVDEIRQDSTLV